LNQLEAFLFQRGLEYGKMFVSQIHIVTHSYHKWLNNPTEKDRIRYWIVLKTNIFCRKSKCTGLHQSLSYEFY
jgi:hypothetical protein